MLSCFMKHSLLILAIFAVIGSLRSEAQSVPVYRTDQDVSEDPVLRKRAEELYSQGLSLPISVVKEQLSRGSCQLVFRNRMIDRWKGELSGHRRARASCASAIIISARAASDGISISHVAFS